MQSPDVAQELGTPGDKRRRPSDFNPYLQGARGAFAMAVFVFHIANSGLSTLPFLSHGLLLDFSLSLQFGVELFFGISGYVIVRALQRVRTPADFMRDRAIRILPVLWATMPFVILLEYLGHVTVVNLSASQFLIALIGNLLCLPTVVPLPLFHYGAWSLSYEMTFYLMMALGQWLHSRTGRGVVLIAAPALALLFLFPRAMFFLPGLMAANGVLDRGPLRPLIRHPLPFLLLFLAAWWKVCVLDPHHLSSSMLGWDDIRLSLTALALISACIAFQGITNGGMLAGRVLCLPLFQYLGTISYSFYMWQMVTLPITKHLMMMAGIVPVLGIWAQATFFLLGLPPTLLVAAVSQRVLERGVSGWLRRQVKKAGRRPVELAPSFAPPS